MSSIQNNKEKLKKNLQKNTQTQTILFNFKHSIIIKYNLSFIPLTTIILYNYKNIKTAAKLQIYLIQNNPNCITIITIIFTHFLLLLYHILSYF